MSNWTTLLDPAITRAGDYRKELHMAFFAPSNWPGKGTTVNLLIPECELQIVMSPDLPLLVNQPQLNQSVKHWLRCACDVAANNSAMLMVSCDTAEQVEIACRRIAKRLPSFRRTAMERMYDVRNRATPSALN